MAYISKNNILAAYKKLCQMHLDPNAQGATQKISAIRHFIALDCFYKLHSRDCNTREKQDRDEFARLVGLVCDVCPDLYTTNFYYPLRPHTGDYCVGSNFYSAGQVKASLVAPTTKFDYPKRGNTPLLRIKNGILKRDTSLYQNFIDYIADTEYAVALIIWLIRQVPVDQNGNSLYKNIYKALSKIFTSELLQELFPSPEIFGQEMRKYNIIFYDTISSINENDIKNLFDGKDMVDENNNISNDSLQLICYGAPGTGKSYKIKKLLDQNDIPEENIFRTTFHPDSDYSTFVGAYKPTMEKEQLYNKDELIEKLKGLQKQGAYSCQKFGARYWYSLRQLTQKDKKDILSACGKEDALTLTAEIDKGIAVGEDLLKKSKESRIIYRFTPQTFLNAYIQAYRKPEESVYLIIEEINRGNCAQIFGDLFQLLDRKENGVSEYTIKADTDLKAFLEDELGKDSAGIKSGELCLPSNLYIYATMNTSDQSLFPIDSAFKRRWDWEYEPIKYGNTDWVINIQGVKFSWVSFQKNVNQRIFDATHSEDKMLGDYFVYPRNKVIDDKILLNKILFYLWNDVCKDGEGDIFRTSATEDVSFSELHGESGKQKLLSMMEYLEVDKIE